MEMAPAGMTESSPKIPPARSLYQALWAAIPFTSVANESSAQAEPNATANEENKTREDPTDTTEFKDQKAEEQQTPGDKPKKNFGKKKEIVSSSTVVPRLEVCIGKKCKAKGSEALLTEFQTASNGRVEIAHTKCMHDCKQGMNTRVTKDGTAFEWHHEVTTTDVAPILCKHFDW